uniref:Uncharacterized protein n=1 Tax=Anopheles atroparvus TaxID=41427 RepID=A0A182IRQ2_ANOAO
LIEIVRRLDHVGCCDKMKIKQEKPSFSDVESESESEPESNKPISPVKIKEEAEESVAGDDDAEDQHDGEQGLAKFVNAWSSEENLKVLERILSRTSVPGMTELKLKQYFKEFSHVKPLLPARSRVEIDLANPDEDTWIVQCPASVDIHSALLNKKLNLSAPRSRIKHCSVPLEAHVKRNSDEKAIGLMCGTQIKSFCPAGFVRITETLADAPVEVELPTESCHVEVPFPEDIRQRHPLLGYDYQETITVPDRVKQRLALAQKQAALFYTNLASTGTPKKTKSKSKRIKQEPEAVTVKIEPESELEMNTVSAKKSKKRKEASVETVVAAEVFPSPRKVIKLENGSPQKKAKQDKEEYNTSSIKKDFAVEDDIAWLLNI